VPVTHQTFTLVLVAQLDQPLAVAIGCIVVPQPLERTTYRQAAPMYGSADRFRGLKW
jgi:hypothetical protein